MFCVELLRLPLLLLWLLSAVGRCGSLWFAFARGVVVPHFAHSEGHLVHAGLIALDQTGANNVRRAGPPPFRPPFRRLSTGSSPLRHALTRFTPTTGDGTD